MPTAFILLNTETGAESEVLGALKNIELVEEAYMVFGVYDIMAKVKADTMGKLKEIVTQRLRTLDKVRSTLTVMAIEEASFPALTQA